MIGKLGKKPPRHDKRTLQLAKYLPSTLPIVPGKVDWTASQPKLWGEMLNNSIGDCAIAASAHLVQSWTHNRPGGEMLTIPDKSILAAYRAVGGYVPGRPETDNGCVMLDVLNYWRKTGIGGHKIAAFVQIDPKDQAMVRAAKWLFGGLYAGYWLPSSIEDQAIWDVVPGETETLGGHAVAELALNTCITWGYVQPLTDRFRAKHCDELYACISEDWFTDGRTIAGFDLDQLRADLELVTK